MDSFRAHSRNNLFSNLYISFVIKAILNAEKFVGSSVVDLFADSGGGACKITKNCSHDHFTSTPRSEHLLCFIPEMKKPVF
jgi:hypothetical protein